MQKIRVVFHDNHYDMMPVSHSTDLYDRVFHSGTRLIGVQTLDSFREKVVVLCDLTLEYTKGRKHPTPCFLVHIDWEAVFFERFIMGVENVPEHG